MVRVRVRVAERGTEHTIDAFADGRIERRDEEKRARMAEEPGMGRLFPAERIVDIWDSCRDATGLFDEF